MAGNDSSAVTSYAVDGARAGFGHLWLMLLSTPLLFAVQFACARIGRIQQKGFGVILRENYSGRVAGGAALILVLANVGLIAADLVAIGSGLELITGLRWIWFIVPVVAALWYITVYHNFDVIKRVFLLMSLAFVTYIITGVMANPDWGMVLSNTFIPHLDFGFGSISAAVALLGATVSPYTMFWQVQGEKEEQRPGRLHEKVRWAAIDIGAGVISGNLVAYFIIVATAGTLFTQHKQITSAVDAAKALEPLLGEAAKYLFALGLIGAGLIAIPVLLASASYGVAGTFGWPSSLSKKPWQNEGFYLILTGALVIGLIIAVLGFDPIQLMFWVNVLQGVLSPVLVVLLILVGNNRKIMGVQRFGPAQNLGLGVTAVVMFTATALLFYGLLTGQGG
jgi:Mn2+/Fe2+ NRAMP family transporter